MSDCPPTLPRPLTSCSLLLFLISPGDFPNAKLVVVIAVEKTRPMFFPLFSLSIENSRLDFEVICWEATEVPWPGSVDDPVSSCWSHDH